MIAAAEKINGSYVGRVLRLTLLAPDLVEAILDGRQPTGLQLEHLLQRFPVGWREQRANAAYPPPGPPQPSQKPEAPMQKKESAKGAMEQK